ncbi:phage tail tube protein [Kitasatospora cathayae]|uniref:Phage tail tube protein n=1 Tax=Kitasatospora cathayae TaxID=3004092 RepID=A0ABY7Q332_9ACTN|nr:phage tail tube protein [Kitasatospora sp. HUAS 3-15]WBP87041.1 phage tail tube protein [Kitasatospora sp. HUAS 3-15]
MTGIRPTAQTVIGIAKETTWGTPVAATAFIPVSPPTPKDVIKLGQDKGFRGSMVETYGEVQLTKHTTFDFSGDVFADTVGFPLAGVLGDVTVTGATAPYTHAMAVYNSNDGQPPSYTITDNYSQNVRQYPGCKFSEFDLKFSADGLLTYTAKAVGIPSVTTTAPTPAYSALQPLASWVGAVTIGGSANLTVLDGNVTIKRPVNVVDTVDGTQAPHALFSGPVSVSGKLTLVMEDETQITNYLNSTGVALDINFQTGTGAALQQVKFHMSQVIYQTADITRGKDFVELPVAFTAMANTSDAGTSAGYSPIKVTLQNANPSGTYK